MKTKKAYSLALAAVMASSVLWGGGSSSTDPGTGAAEASDSGTKEAGGGQTLRISSNPPRLTGPMHSRGFSGLFCLI